MISAELRRVHCTSCPVQMFCSSGIWPPTVYKDREVFQIKQTGTLVRCNASTIPFSNSHRLKIYGQESRLTIYEGIILYDGSDER